MISFVIPAHNEERLLGRTLHSIFASAAASGEPFEVIVVDDASTDGTAAIAREHGARVLSVQNRQIAATRNAGARAAVGDMLVFVDADTSVTPRLVRAAVRAIRRGVVGGGCDVRFDGRVPPYATLLLGALRLLLRAVGLTGGCFVFCTRRAYLAAGGFDETLYVSEEVAFVRRLKRLGRFVILRESAITSGRKMRTHTAVQLLGLTVRLALAGPQSLRRREGLDFWYDPRTRG
jgi:glycosyltransferase involved in cell wall biosynthesis